MLQARLCDLFAIEHPVLNAPMGGGDAPAELAAAVSAAGGLGLIGGTTIGGTEWLVAHIRRARELTDRPFGVGFISHLPSAAKLMAAALDEGVRIIAHSFADPAPFVGAAHDAGALVNVGGRRSSGVRVTRTGNRDGRACDLGRRSGLVRDPYRERGRHCACPRRGGRRRLAPSPAPSVVQRGH